MNEKRQRLTSAEDSCPIDGDETSVAGPLVFGRFQDLSQFPQSGRSFILGPDVEFFGQGIAQRSVQIIRPSGRSGRWGGAQFGRRNADGIIGNGVVSCWTGQPNSHQTNQDDPSFTCAHSASGCSVKACGIECFHFFLLCSSLFRRNRNYSTAFSRVRWGRVVGDPFFRLKLKRRKVTAVCTGRPERND